MGERDKNEGREFNLYPTNQEAADSERERKLRVLKRISEAIGRPVEDFYKISTEAKPPKEEPSSGG